MSRRVLDELLSKTYAVPINLTRIRRNTTIISFGQFSTTVFTAIEDIDKDYLLDFLRRSHYDVMAVSEGISDKTKIRYFHARIFKEQQFTKYRQFHSILKDYRFSQPVPPKM